MPVNDALLFIDANKYLDLYRTNTGKNLLPLLGEQVDYIFVPQQIVNEVQRNKVQVAAAFLNQECQELKLPTFNVPKHLDLTDTGRDIRHKIDVLAQTIRAANGEGKTWAAGIMEQIGNSKDEVSNVLSTIFANAVAHSPEELQKARDRKELGNPPGKSGSPIGDQLIWEQILTHFKGKQRLWIISRDSDYGTVYDGKTFLNGFLYDELCQVASDPIVHLFQDTVEGIKHFVEIMGVKAEQRLTPEDAEEIKKEEQSLPSLPYLVEPSESMRQIAATVDPYFRANELMRQKLAADLDPLFRAVDPYFRANELMRQKLASDLERSLRANELMRQKLAADLEPRKLDGVMSRKLDGLDSRKLDGLD
jgi:PIN domain